MTKVLKFIDKKAGEMSQEKFNKITYSAIGVVIFSMMAYGLTTWLNN